MRPEHWDAEARQVKVQKGTPHASINPRLNRAHEAALETARKQGHKRPPAELRAALDAALALTPVTVTRPPQFLVAFCEPFFELGNGPSHCVLSHLAQASRPRSSDQYLPTQLTILDENCARFPNTASRLGAKS